MTEVPTLLDGVVQGLIENLNEATHTGKVFVHLSSRGKVAERKKHGVSGCITDYLSYSLIGAQSRRRRIIHFDYESYQERKQVDLGTIKTIESLKGGM